MKDLRSGSDSSLSQPALNPSPIHIRKEGIDIFRAIGRRVIEDEGVLPRVHYKDRIEPADIPDFMKRDPVIREGSGIRILITHCPADASHFSNTDKVGFPQIEAADRLLSSRGERLVGTR